MKTLMKKLFILTMLVTAIAAFAVAAPATAQTPDGETPANEGVCDVLIGSTPGLYGLCVAFCEAQDCEATYDPATDEVTFDPDCKPSNPKILENYNRRMKSEDIDMPCINFAVSECPCWTEEELDEIADGYTLYCKLMVGTDGWYLGGYDQATQGYDIALVGGTDMNCLYQETGGGGFVVRNIDITDDERVICEQSIINECTSRGF